MSFARWWLLNYSCTLRTVLHLSMHSEHISPFPWHYRWRMRADFYPMSINRIELQRESRSRNLTRLLKSRATTDCPTKAKLHKKRDNRRAYDSHNVVQIQRSRVSHQHKSFIFRSTLSCHISRFSLLLLRCALGSWWHHRIVAEITNSL